ncbi:MBL fold metallo-hydrolase [Candidatus Margulisiibacteriota bacterium]
MIKILAHFCYNKNMEIKTIPVGGLQTNCYIVSDKKTKEAIIIDPGEEANKIVKGAAGLKIKSVVLTHGHYDHVTDARYVADKFNAPLLINQNDEAMMAYSNQSKADKYLVDGEKLAIGQWSVVIISSPGHSAGGICLYNESEKVLFSGDTLFEGTWGRTDLPGSSEQAMLDSLKKLLSLSEDIRVYPGHGPSTTIGAEKNLISW